MADSDYVCVYRQFFEEFAKVVEPNDPLPIRVASYNLSADELTGEIIESCVQYLNEKNCPSSLLVPLTKMVVEEIQREAKKQPQHMYQPLKVMQTVTAKINEVCLRYIDNEKLSSLPAPVQETCYSTHAIKHTRRKMEDRLICLPRFNTLYNVKSNTEAGYYAVFDGHNGSDAASFAVSHLHQFLAESKYYPEDSVRAFKDAYAKTESRYKSKELKSGTTAVAIVHQPVEKKLIVSWLGDSQAMLVTRGNYVMLVEPHKPERPDECRRIESQGGFVVNVDGLYRINGQLAVSRAIGDHQYKPIVSAEPDVRIVDLDGSEDFFVVGCDGLWDVVDPKDVVETVYFQVKEKPGNIASVSKRLVDLAKENGSTDNISVIVVFLTDPAELCKRSVEETTDGRWPTNPFHNGLIMEANVESTDKSSPFSMPFGDSGINGSLFEKNGKRSDFRDGNKEDSDEDFGPETDVDAVDDILVSPLKNGNPFANDCTDKSQTDEISKLIEYSIHDNETKDDRKFDTNPFDPFGTVNLPKNDNGDNKYVEHVKLENEEIDNLLNCNLVDDTFNLGCQLNDKSPNDSNKDLFATENELISKTEIPESDFGFKADDVDQKVEKVEEKEEEEAPTKNDLLEFIGNLGEEENLESEVHPPALCSVVDAFEADRISQILKTSLKEPETEELDAHSPSAPILDGETKDDVVVVAESGGEGEDSEDDEWNYYKVDSGVAAPDLDKTTDLVINADVSVESDQKMNSPLNPDAAEFVPVSPPSEPDLKSTPLKSVPAGLDDIIAASPNWSNMESVKLPEESSFMQEVKSRPSNILEGIEPLVLEEPKNPEIEEKSEEPEVKEASGIDLATDMTSSFIDHSTISAQSEISKQELEFILQQNEKPVMTEPETCLNVNAPEFKAEETATKEDLLSPLSLQEEPSPAPETPKSTMVEAPISPRSELASSEPLQSNPVEPQAGPEASPTIQTPPSTPLANEEIGSRPERLDEAFEKLTVGDNPSDVGAIAAGAAVAVAAVAGVAAVAKEDKKATTKPASAKPAAKTTATSKPAATKTTAATKKPLPSTAPAAKPAAPKPAVTASRTVTSKVSATKAAPAKPPSTVATSPPKAAPRPRPASATTTTVTGAAKSTTPTAKTTVRSTATRTTPTTTKPRVPSAPIEKKPVPSTAVNGESKPAVKRAEPLRKPTVPSTTTTRTATSRPATAPPKTATSRAVSTTTTTTSRTTTVASKPRTTTTTTSSNSASRLTSTSARKTVTERQVISKVTSKTTAAKTNGVANGKLTTSATAKGKKPASAATPSKTKTENKTEIKAESVLSENEKPKQENLTNGIGSE